MSNNDRYVVLVEWYDQPAQLIRKYNLIYYLSDDTIEMFDLKSKKCFLKRTTYPSVTLKDFYIGNVINIYSRQLKITEYADSFTKNKFEEQKERTFAMIKPNAYQNIGLIIAAIEEAGFLISQVKMTQFGPKEVSQFYAEHLTKPFYPNLAAFMTSDFVVGMELIGQNAIQKWRDLIGPTNSEVARQQAPRSLRAQFGIDGTKNACHGSDSAESANREIDFFFGSNSPLRSTAQLNNCTCAVIKPHVFRERNVGKIIDMILQEGFEISAMQLFKLDKPTSEEFLEVYKNLLPEYNDLAEHLTEGPCIALEIRQENVVNSFRQICGPHDPQIAKNIRQSTIRAKFGHSSVQNAVHCTDLEEDGPLECEYFFRLLQ